MIALFVASHYKNSPNDLQLMSDAPSHHLFVLLGPVDVNASKLPDVLACVQVSLEGQISRESVQRAMSRGEAPSGDLIPWSMSTQFQESDFAALSGARIVRVAVHPELQHMGYGSRAIGELTRYYQGDVNPARAAGKSKGKGQAKAAASGGAGSGGGLLEEQLAPRAELPPLLLTLSQRPAERLHWVGSSFGLTVPLFRFWHRAGFLPVYVRQTKNDTTGEHTVIVLRPLEERDDGSARAAAGWASEYAADFRRRLTSLLGLSLSELPVELALSLLDPELSPPAAAAPSLEQQEFLFGPYDMKRLSSYAKNLVDHHLVMDLLPSLATLRFTNRLRTQLSHVQAALLLGLGLQHKTLEALELELGLPASQMLALFNKAMRKMVNALSSVHEAAEEATLPARDAAGSASAHLTPLPGGRLDAELDAGAASSLKKLQAEQASKQKAWLDDEDGLAQYAVRGSAGEWDAALGAGGAIPKHVSVKGDASARASKHKHSDGGKPKKSKGDGGGSGGGGKRHKK